MNCEQVTKEEITEKYLLGRLTEAEQGAFELHFFECERCFEEVESLRVLQTELRRAASAIREQAPGRKNLFWRWAWAQAAALAIFFVVGIVWWIGRPKVAPVEPPSPVVHIPTPKPVPQASVPSLAELAQVRPPEYAPGVLRGVQDEAMQRFRASMRDYVKGNYAAAIPGLRAASKLNPQASDTSFFLGICYLLTDQTDAAIKQLRRTAELGDSPYLEETHFYLAKCSLRKGDLRTARNELDKTIRLQGEREGEARELLQQLETLGKKSHEPR
jgi:tetratricopeptide (TPR) repeat protein